MSGRPRPGDVCVPASFAVALAGPLSSFVSAGRLRGDVAVSFVRDLAALARIARVDASVFGVDAVVLVVDVELASAIAHAVVAATEGLIRSGVEVRAEVVAVVRELTTVGAHTCDFSDPADALTMLSVTTIADRHGLHRNTVLDAIHREALPAVRTSAGYRISETDAAAWRSGVEEKRSA